jgi:hypothetical protein
MASKAKLEELRQAVLGNRRGREVEVDPSGQVILDPGPGQNPESQPDQESDKPKPAKMSPHTWGI